MKKLLFLLLPLFCLAQDLKLDHSYINAADFEVGDTITIKFNTIQVTNNVEPNLYIFDYEYNNKLLQKITHRFKVTDNSANTNAQTSLTHWDGFKYKILSTYDEDNLSAQYLNGWLNRTQVEGDTNSYPTDDDWSVERITIQDGVGITYNNTLIEVDFKIKDKINTNYNNYNNVTHLNWMRAEDNSTSTQYDVDAMQQKITLSDVEGGDAGSVTINLNTANDKPTHYKYNILSNNNSIASGNFDASSQAIVTGLENDVKYDINITVDNELASDWLDDVVTVTDVFLVFKEAIGAGTSPGETANTFTHSIQYLLGEVNNSGNVDFDDSYVMLSHIMDENVSEYFTNSTNGAKDVWGEKNQYGYSTDDYYFGQKKHFTPTDANKIFNFGHGLIGDVDFSHSFEPIVEDDNEGVIKIPSVQGKIENLDLDISTSLVNDKVELLVELEKDYLAGMQFIIQFDNTILEFEEIKFNTGNLLTNFATERDDKLYFGSISVENKENIKVGKPYKIIFNTKQTVTNASGLIYFKTTDAVTSDGTKVILKIQ
tara:strand:+ start:7070 stop:8695 length:1626 start_codon:yes stop_codon:yes gene_type:complete